MPVLFKKYQLHKENSKFNGKWYGRPVMVETVDLEGLARHMASHSSPFTYGTIIGVLRDMTVCVRELVLQSRQVKLDNLCIFKAAINQKTGGADLAKDYTVDNNIESLRLTARATGSLTRVALTRAAQEHGPLAKEYSIYDDPYAQKTQNP